MGYASLAATLVMGILFRDIVSAAYYFLLSRGINNKIIYGAKCSFLNRIFKNIWSHIFDNQS